MDGLVALLGWWLLTSTGASVTTWAEPDHERFHCIGPADRGHMFATWAKDGSFGPVYLHSSCAAREADKMTTDRLAFGIRIPLGRKVKPGLGLLVGERRRPGQKMSSLSDPRIFIVGERASTVASILEEVR